MADNSDCSHPKCRENGIAMPMVMVLVVVLSILSLVAMSSLRNQNSLITAIQDKENALHYAEVGYNRYLWQLNSDPYFYKTEESEAMCEADKHKFANGYYKLSVTSPTEEDPNVTITSIGWLDGKESSCRRLQVKVHQRTFTEYVNFTHDYGGTGWGDGEVLEGPIHTNGTLKILGNARFMDVVTYGKDLSISSGKTPVFDKAAEGYPMKVSTLTIPQSNFSLKQWAELGGYYIEGRVRIHLEYDKVRIKCFPDSSSDETEVLWDLPANGVIYVNKVAGASNTKFGRDSGNVFINGTLQGRLTVACSNDIFITAKDPTDDDFATADCVQFSDTFQGVPLTKTVALRYHEVDPPKDGDMLGLVAGTNVFILSHDWPSGTSPYSTTVSDVALNDIQIEAALFAVGSNCSYGVEDYNDGPPKGHIHLNGSVIQSKSRATFSQKGGTYSGYKEHNVHDSRMLINSPPRFLLPDNAGWEVKEWVEDK